MLKTLELNGKEYSVERSKYEDESGNIHEVLLLKNGKDELRLSPNTTDEELKAYADPNDRGHDNGTL